jgi:hypothetical protein
MKKQGKSKYLRHHVIAAMELYLELDRKIQSGEDELLILKILSELVATHSIAF